MIKYSNTLQDNHLRDVDKHDLECIKYHVDTCYSWYKRKCDRANEKKSDCSASTSNSVEKEEQGQETCRSTKWFRFDEKKSTTICIICRKSKYKGDTKLYKISEHHSAKNFLPAAHFFKDDGQTRCILWKTPGDVFATDVIYHKNCFGGYVLKFKREIELIMRDSDDECTETVIKYVLMSMDLTTSAYHLSDLHEEVNRQLFSQDIGESILHDFVDCLVAKTLVFSDTFKMFSPIVLVFLQSSYK